MRVLAVLLAALAALLAGCVTPDPQQPVSVDDAGPLGAACVMTSDCLAGELCGYAIDAGCAATGVCVAEDLTCENDGPIVCDCFGDPVGLSCIYGAGNAPAPVPGTTAGCAPLDGGFD